MEVLFLDFFSELGRDASGRKMVWSHYTYIPRESKAADYRATAFAS
jgi:hypothetical protein